VSTGTPPRQCIVQLHVITRAARRATARASRTSARRDMALAALSEDGQRIIFTQLCNVLDPRIAVALSSANHGLWAATQALRQQLKADHKAAAALCRKLGLRSCKALREAKEVDWFEKGLTATDLTLLGTLGSVLPALEKAVLIEASFPDVTDGMQRLAAGLGAGALPAVRSLTLSMHMGDAGASALAAALGRGALPRLESIMLHQTSIGDAGLVALAPALRRLPALENINLWKNPLGDEGLAALVAPPPPTGMLAKLKWLYLGETRVDDAGCAALAAALNRGALPALDMLDILLIPASAAAKEAVRGALASSRAARLPS
jgi:hypothetical protein